MLERVFTSILFQAVLLYQCLQGLEGGGPSTNLEKLAEFVKELKTSIDAEPARKGVKAQKVSCLSFLVLVLYCVKYFIFSTQSYLLRSTDAFLFYSV